MWMFRHGAVGLLFTEIDIREWRRALFVPTGALLSATSFHEGENVPGIAHGVLLEHAD